LTVVGWLHAQEYLVTEAAKINLRFSAVHERDDTSWGWFRHASANDKQAKHLDNYLNINFFWWRLELRGRI
jgi:hypothetical protein